VIVMFVAALYELKNSPASRKRARRRLS